MILPIASFAETDGTFVNRSGRVQRIREAISPPAQARAGWLVLSELLGDLGQRSFLAPSALARWSRATIAAGVPSGANRLRASAVWFETRTQPCETACPSS